MFHRTVPTSHLTPGKPIHDLASRLRRLPPSCGPVRLVGVDGHAGSGKTTFAGRLATALGRAPVLHLADIATHEELFGWTERLLSGVIEPLGRAEPHATPPTTGRPGSSDRCARHRPRPWCSWRASARDAVRCGRGSRDCCGWSCPTSRPGHGDGDGTGRHRASSGTDGSAPSAGTSPRTPRARSRTMWCGSVQRDTRCCRGLLGRLDRTSSSRTVMDHPQRAEVVKTHSGEVASVPQLCLTRGPYRSYVLKQRPFGSRPQSRSPRLFPRDRGLRSAHTLSFRTPHGVIRSPWVTVRSAPHMLPPRGTGCAAPFGRPVHRRYDASRCDFRTVAVPHRFNSRPRHSRSTRAADGHRPGGKGMS